jgi:hypothetical protein
MPEQKLNLKNIEAFLVLYMHYNQEKDYGKLLSDLEKKRKENQAEKEKAEKVEKPGK